MSGEQESAAKKRKWYVQSFKEWSVDVLFKYGLQRETTITRLQRETTITMTVFANLEMPIKACFYTA